LPVIFVCGKLLLTPVPHDINGHNSPYLIYNRIETGWPWVFRVVDEHDDGLTSLPLARNPVSFSAKLFLADVAVLGPVCLLAIMVTVWVLRKNRGKWQFSLRALLAFTAIIAAGLGWWVNERAGWQFEQDLQRKWKDSVFGLGSFGSDGFTPEWAKRVLPDESHFVFDRASGFYVKDAESAEAVEAELPELARLRYVHRITFVGQPLDRPIRFANSAVLHRIDSIKNLYADDETLTQLSEAPNLQRLSLYGPITARGLAQLKRCTALTDLGMANIKLSDSAAQQLLEFPRLEFVCFGDSSDISAETMRRLKEHVPQVYTD
jgi:hypothetical protein